MSHGREISHHVFCAVIMIGSSVCCSEQCPSVSGQLLNTAAIVCELFSVKLNELAVMHFDLQFNNLI